MALKFLDLNYECIYHICKFLELDDANTVAQSCYPLEDIMQVIWKKKYHHLDLTTDMLKHSFFLRTVCKFVKSLSTASDILYNFLITYDDVEFPQLQQLEIFGNAFYNNIQGNQILYSQVAERCVDIVELRLTNQLMESDLISKMTNLKRLRLQCCFLKDVSDLFNICKHLPLDSLYLERMWGYKQVHFRFMNTCCKHIKEMKIMQYFLGYNPHEICCLPKLETLVVGLDFDQDINQVALENVVKEMGERIYYFGAGFNVRLDEPLYNNILNMKGLRTLQFNWIHVPDVTRFTELPELGELLLIYCTGINNRGLIEVVDKCKKLKLIDVRGSEGVTSQLVHMAERLLMTTNRQTVGKKLDFQIKINAPYLVNADREGGIAATGHYHRIREDENITCYKLKFQKFD